MTTKWSAAVARAMHELEAATPSAPPWESMQLVPSHPEHSRRRAPLLVGAMVALAASGLAGLVVLRGDQPERSSAPAGATMHHVRVTYSLTSDLTCDEFPSAETSTAEIELFADRAGRRWRTSVAASDGATADLILAGSYVYPTARWERGVAVELSANCPMQDGDNLLVWSGPTSPPSLLNVAAELGSDEAPFVSTHGELGVDLGREEADALGRPGHLWEQRIDGFLTWPTNPQLPITQVTRWWVDPADGTTVLQRQFTYTLEGLGEVVETETLVEDVAVALDETVFATDGFRPGEVEPRPSLPGPDGPGPLETAPTTCASDDLDLSQEPSWPAGTFTPCS